MEIEISLEESKKYIENYSSFSDYHNTNLTRYNEESDFTYNKFFNDNLIKNTPCIIGDWLTKEWKFSKEWVGKSGNIDYDFLIKEFGSASVPVANCNQKFYNSQKKEYYTLESYINCIREKQEFKSTNCHYLKDWHFVHNYQSYEGYITPKYFSSDWLNEFWSCKDDIENDDDYRFVYLGPNGSWTPFHVDVFQSFSWSSNICGRKKWVFYPPLEENHLKDKLGNLIYDIESSELSDKEKYPNACQANGRLEVIQEKGETIFVPSSWHHQVWNLEDTLSVNHNWINGANILIVWEFLKSSLVEVEKAIEDCVGMDGWTRQCQLILKSTHGMDFLEFFKFLSVIARRRIQYLEGDETLSSFSSCRFGRNHVMFDLRMLKVCLERLMGQSHSDNTQLFADDDHPNVLLEEIEQVL